MALSRLGQTYGIILHKSWSCIYKRFKKPPYSNKREAQLANKNYVPLTLGLLVTVFFILVCSLYFYLTLGPAYRSQHQRFTFFTSFYFTMITFLTIGFGEYSPVKYKLIFSNLILIMIGLSLVALCISLFKFEIEEVVNDLIDMIDKEYTEIVDNDEKTMSDDKRNAVKTLIAEKQKSSGIMTKVFVASMGKGEEKRLQQLYEEKSKFISTYVQAKADIMDLQMQYPEKNGFSCRSYSTYVENSCQADLDEENCYEKFAQETNSENNGIEKLFENIIFL